MYFLLRNFWFEQKHYRLANAPFLSYSLWNFHFLSRFAFPSLCDFTSCPHWASIIKLFYFFPISWASYSQFILQPMSRDIWLLKEYNIWVGRVRFLWVSSFLSLPCDIDSFFSQCAEAWNIPWLASEIYASPDFIDASEFPGHKLIFTGLFLSL